MNCQPGVRVQERNERCSFFANCFDRFVQNRNLMPSLRIKILKICINFQYFCFLR